MKKLFVIALSIGLMVVAFTSIASAYTLSETYWYTGNVAWIQEDYWDNLDPGISTDRNPFYNSGFNAFFYTLGNVNFNPIKALHISNPGSIPIYWISSPTGWMHVDREGNPSTSYTGSSLWLTFNEGSRITAGNTLSGFAIKSTYPRGIVPTSIWDTVITYPSGVVSAPVMPEPTSMLLLGMGILGVFGLRRKRSA